MMQQVVSHPILLIEGLVLSLEVKWYMSLENGEGGLPGMKGGAWYENTVFIVWGLSGLEEADQVSDEEASSGNQQEQQVAAPAREQQLKIHPLKFLVGMMQQMVSHPILLIEGLVLSL